MSIIHAGGEVVFEDIDWSGAYQLKPYPIYDAAKRLTSGMYVAGTAMCLSFHIKKTLAIGKGGMILTDDYKMVEWLKKARYEGRSGVNYKEDNIDMLGWNMYMTPQQASHGLALMQNYPEHMEDLGEDNGYRDLTENDIFKADNEPPLKEPAAKYRDSATFEDRFFPYLKQQLKASSKVLEIGAGNGRIMRVLEKYFSDVEGMDPEEHSNTGSQNISVSTVESWNKGPYDLIISVGVAYLFEPQTIFEEYKRLSHPGTILVVAGDPENTKEIFDYFRGVSEFEYAIEFPEFRYEAYRMPAYRRYEVTG